VRRAKGALANLEAFFGPDAKAPSLTPTRIDAYAEHRLGAGASRATISYERAMLRRSFRLAIEKGLLATMPIIKTPGRQSARGFL
jgi:hypothetical protein